MIAGNYEDKYHAKNPISRLLVANFLKDFHKCLTQVNNPQTIAELGAGEGYLTEIISNRFPRAKIIASDLSINILKIAEKNTMAGNVHFEQQEISRLSYKDNSCDLIICCEVLEHVKNPQKALQEIHRVGRGFFILSVPHEPLWRILNMARGKYWHDLGNTPGHINHWTKNDFAQALAGGGFDIIQMFKPLPWIMVLAAKKKVAV